VFPVDPRGLHWFEYFNDFSYGLQRFVLHDGILVTVGLFCD
jgi:hypothetical protein